MLFDHLLATVTTPGELGTVMNWNQHNLPGLLTKPGEELARILGEPLPAEAQPTQSYHGPTRIIVPTTRTSLAANEALKLKVIILSEAPPRAATLCWRKLGDAPVCADSAEVGGARGLFRSIARRRQRRISSITSRWNPRTASRSISPPPPRSSTRRWWSVPQRHPDSLRLRFPGFRE